MTKLNKLHPKTNAALIKHGINPSDVIFGGLSRDTYSKVERDENRRVVLGLDTHPVLTATPYPSPAAAEEIYTTWVDEDIELMAADNE